jgi:uncharacterized protein (DUF1697 family)
VAEEAAGELAIENQVRNKIWITKRYTHIKAVYESWMETTTIKTKTRRMWTTTSKSKT